ncbi:MAG: carboxypeptidase regulatory-like domain-containing protein [Blastocatellia bacterium]
MRVLINHGLVLCLLSALCMTAKAQNNEASLKVTVTDPLGARVHQARVRAESPGGKSRGAETSRAGEALVTRLAPGLARVTVEADGFQPQLLSGIRLNPGANNLAVTLVVADVRDEIQVARDKRESATDLRGDAFSSVLNAEQLAALPDDPEEFEQAIRNMAGPGARFRVNGFGGGKFPPKSHIREIRFRPNGYAADTHDFAHMSVDIYTKPGVDGWHGSLNLGFRDEALNARNAFAPFRGAEQDRRYNLELSGPLWKNHTSAFLSADGMDSYTTQTIFTALPTGNFADLIRRPVRRLNLQSRVEHALNKTHTLRGEYQRNALRQENLGAGNFDLASRAYTSDLREHIFRVSDSGAMGKHLFNEIRFQTQWQDVGLRSLSNARTINVLSGFTSGGAQVTSDRHLREIEITDNLDITRFKKHQLRTGFTVEAARYNSSELRNQNGTFTFASLADFLAGRPLQFSQRSGAPAVAFNQYQFGWYMQDDWRVTKNLSLSFGARHEVQTNLGDRNNFAPRLGLAWSPFRNGKTTFRGGSGIFYDWFGSTTVEQILRVNGQRQNDLIIRNPGYPDPFSGGSSITLPPSVIQQDARLRMPYAWQSSFGVERELAQNLRLMTSYTYTRGARQLRGLNINQPIASLGRPIPGQGNITQVASIANSHGHTMMVNLNWTHLPKHIFLAANYRLGKTTNDADTAFSLPVDSRNLRAERGPALNDIRHMFMMMAGFPVYKNIRAGMTFNALSAMPYNIVTGLDNNGDAVINDRPVGFGRNSARGAAQANLGMRLSWSSGFGKPKEQSGPQVNVRVIRGGGDDMPGAMPGVGQNNKRYKTEFYVSASNLLNRANPLGFIGVQTSPFFGQPIAAMPGRRMETGVRLSF